MRHINTDSHDAALAITVDGVTVSRLNSDLVAAHDLDEGQITKIKKLHVEKYKMVRLMELSSKEEVQVLREIASAISDIEFELQKEWGFTQDANFHRWWNLPHCACPKLDNEDAYPSGYYVVSDACVLHGHTYDTAK